MADRTTQVQQVNVGETFPDHPVLSSALSMHARADKPPALRRQISYADEVHGDIADAYEVAWDVAHEPSQPVAPQEHAERPQLSELLASSSLNEAPKPKRQASHTGWYHHQVHQDLVVPLTAGVSSEFSAERAEHILIASVVGGKALHLAQLNELSAVQTFVGVQAPPWRRPKTAAVLKVPEAACLTTYAYKRHIDSLQLGSRIESLLASAATDASESVLRSELASIRASIMGEQSTALLRASPVLSAVEGFISSLPLNSTLAVRSSGTLEDQAGVSWAGQYETILNVPREATAVVEAILNCWASTWEDHILAYRSHLKVGSTLPSMAVVLQRQLAPLSSGVLFTLNPTTGATGEMVVESCWGLGEGVVAGEISPHLFSVDWVNGKVLSRHTPKQTKKFAFKRACDDAKQAVDAGASTSDAGGKFIHVTQTTEDEQNRTSIGDEHLLDLTELALQVARYYRHPQDLEWALTEDGIYILQTRPITAFTVQVSHNWSYGGFADSCCFSNYCVSQAYARYQYSMRHLHQTGQLPDSCWSTGFQKKLPQSQAKAPDLKASESSKQPWVLLSKQGVSSSLSPERFGDQPDCAFFFGTPYMNAANLYSHYRQHEAYLEETALQAIFAVFDPFFAAIAEAQRTLEPTRAQLRKSLWAIHSLFEDSAPEDASGLVEQERKLISDDELRAYFDQFANLAIHMDVASFSAGGLVSVYEEQMQAMLDSCGTSVRVDALAAGAKRAEDSVQGSSQELRQLGAWAARSKTLTQYLLRDELPVESKSADNVGAAAPRLTRQMSEASKSRSALATMHASEDADVREFARRFDVYLDRWYFMSASDEDLGEPRFREDPSIPLAILKSIVKQETSDAATSASDNKTAGEDWELAQMRVIESLGDGDVSRFLDLVALMRFSLRWKESIHMFYTINGFYVRQLVRCRVRRLRQDALHMQSLTASDSLGLITLDVFKCEKHHPLRIRGSTCSMATRSMNYWHADAPLMAMLWDPQLSSDADRLRQLSIRLFDLAMHRRMYELFEQPQILRAKGVNQVDKGRAEVAAGAPTASTLSGLSCSGGQAIGHVRILSSLAESPKIQKGDVLCTQFTNPSWTPLFSLISGVIVECGGILSHSAVVARECGIPCVSQVRGASNRLRDGQMVCVDGDRGIVSLLV